MEIVTIEIVRARPLPGRPERRQGRAGAGPATETRGDEHPCQEPEMGLLDVLDVLLAASSPILGTEPAPRPPVRLRPMSIFVSAADLVRQVLGVRVRGHELRAVDALLHHPGDGVPARAPQPTTVILVSRSRRRSRARRPSSSPTCSYRRSSRGVLAASSLSRPTWVPPARLRPPRWRRRLCCP